MIAHTFFWKPWPKHVRPKSEAAGYDGEEWSKGPGLPRSMKPGQQNKGETYWSQTHRFPCPEHTDFLEREEGHKVDMMENNAVQTARICCVNKYSSSSNLILMQTSNSDCHHFWYLPVDGWLTAANKRKRADLNVQFKCSCGEYWKTCMLSHNLYNLYNGTHFGCNSTQKVKKCWWCFNQTSYGFMLLLKQET